MLTPIRRRPALLIAALAAGAPASAGAQLFGCHDTPYPDSQRVDLLASRHHVLQVYGDASARSTNFFAEGYDGVVSGVDLRLVVPRLSELSTGPVALPDPFVGVSARSLHDVDWEDRLDFAAGVEWRPLKRARLPAGAARWLYHVRLYASRHATHYLAPRDEWSWRPRADTRLGAELYRECNLHAGGRLWAEVWADASWRRTDFVIEDFRAWTAAVVPRVGMRLGPGPGVMPYTTGEVITTERSEAWQNRVLLGVGLRLMPFRLEQSGAGGLLRGTRIYVEHLWLVTYVEGAADAAAPARDLRGGVAVALNRWE